MLHVSDARREYYLRVSQKSRAHQTAHGFVWFLKLITPDFIIPHPSLSENTHIVRRHPVFHFFRRAFTVWLIFALAFSGFFMYTKVIEAAPGTSGVKNTQTSDDTTDTNTEGAANAAHANKLDPNTGGIGDSTETLHVRIDNESDPGATLPVEVRLTTAGGVVSGGYTHNVRTRIYQCSSSCGSAGNWSQVGSDVTTPVSIALTETDSGWIDTGNTIALGTSGDITYYSVLAWSQDAQGADQSDPASADMRANANSNQSGLVFTVGPITDDTEYEPTNGATTDPVTVSGTIGYEYGAVPSDFGGTGDDVTITFYDPDGGVVGTLTPTIEADGDFTDTFTPTEGDQQNGEWTIQVDFAHDGDTVTDSVNVDMLLAISSINYQLFTGDDTTAAKESADSGVANLGAPVFIEVTPHNNSAGTNLTGLEAVWNVTSPPANVPLIYDSASGLLRATTTIPAGVANVGAGSISVTGIGRDSVTAATNISGFSSDQSITLSDTYQMSTSNTVINDGVTTDHELYNQGETVTSDVYLYNVRNQLITGEPANSLTLTVLSDVGGTEETINNEDIDSGGNVAWSYVTAASDKNTSDQIGSPKRLKIDQNDGNTVTSGDEWGLSDLLQVSTTSLSIDDGITTDYDVYNQGETVVSDLYLFNARDEILASQTNEYTLVVLDDVGGTEETIINEDTDGSGNLAWSYLTVAADKDTNDNSGSPKRLHITDTASNTVTTGSEWALSSLLTVDDIFHAKFTTSVDESENFIIGADNVVIKTHVIAVRGDTKVGASITSALKSPGNTVVDTWTGTTGGDGYTAYESISPQTPAGAWTLNSAATDANGNYAATTTEPVYFISPYTANLGLRTVGWNQEYSPGDTATFTVQIIKKDADDVWNPQAPDTGTTPFYDVNYWSGSAWVTALASTSLSLVTGTASSTWEGSYDIPDDVAEIGKQYAVSFNARITGAQMATLKEFAVIDAAAGGVAGDPLTVSASPGRAAAGDTVRLTIRESNLDATVLTGNTASTSVYIYDADNTTIVNGDQPTEIGSGAYYYDYDLGSSPELGNWQALIVVSIDGSDYSAATNFQVADALVTRSDLNTATSTIVAEINENQTSIGTAISGISGVSSAVSGLGTAISSNATAISNASSSLSSQIGVNLTAIQNASSSLGAKIENASSSLGSKIDALDAKLDSIIATLDTVDANIDALQTTANDMWSAQQEQYQITVSDVSQIQSGEEYWVKLTIEDFQTDPVDADSTPQVIIYDPVRAVEVATTSLTWIGQGQYQYSYTTATSSPAGLYEALIMVDVGGDMLRRSDFFQVTGSPAQVIINGLTLPFNLPGSMTANVSIQNEGNADFEYQYEWCVVSSETNACGGGDDVHYGSAAKLIAVGDTFTTNLPANLTASGDYYFKLVVYYGTESSGASESFTVVGSGGGGSGGGSSGGGSISNRDIYDAISTLRGELSLESIKIQRVIDLIGNVDPYAPGFRSVLTIGEENTEDLHDIQNKLADLAAVSNLVRRLAESGAEETLVEQFMKFNSVEIHFLASNPTDERTTTMLRSVLPREVKPEHIMKKNGFTIEFEPAEDAYVAYKEVTIPPHESVTHYLELKDIWVFEEKELEGMVLKAEQFESLLVDTQYGAQAGILLADIDERVRAISRTQFDSYTSPQEHILVYRENAHLVEEIQKNIDKLEQFTIDAGVGKGLLGRIGGIQTIGTWGIILAVVCGIALLAFLAVRLWQYQINFIAEQIGGPKLAVAGVGGGVVPATQGSSGTLKARKKSPSVAQESAEELPVIEYGDGESDAEELPPPVQPQVPSTEEEIVDISDVPERAGLFMSSRITLVLLGLVALGVVLLAHRFFGDRSVEVYTAPTVSEEQRSTPSLVDTEVIVTDAANTAPQVRTLVVQDTETGWLRVRIEPRITADEITRLTSGAVVEYVLEHDGWYNVILEGGTTGWVSGEYVTVIDREE